MKYEVHPKEFESIVSQSASRRYQYFLDKVADWRQLWSVADDIGWSLVEDEDGNQLVPVWPAEAYAAAFCHDEWQNRKPRVISLDDWLSAWIPGMTRDKRMVSVFPVRGTHGVRVEPERLSEDLREALASYED